MNVDEMRAKLAYARKRLTAAREAQANAEALSKAARELGGGLLSFGGSGNQSAKRRVQGAQSRAFRAHADAEDRIKLWTDKIRSLETRIAEAERQRLIAEDLKGATHVQDRYGTWRRVVRVSAKSVTVETAYSWTDRILIEQIRDFRAIEVEQ